MKDLPTLKDLNYCVVKDDLKQVEQVMISKEGAAALQRKQPRLWSWTDSDPNARRPLTGCVTWGRGCIFFDLQFHPVQGRIT